MTTEQISVPASWPGTRPEWTVFITLQQLGKVPGRDFSYQGRDSVDGVAFRFVSPGDLGINVAGMMQDYSTGTDNRGLDQITTQQALGSGMRRAFIDDVDLVQDPTYYVEEALEYRDHSHMGG